MIVKDAMLAESGQIILTGPLLLKEFSRKSEIEQAFGEHVTLFNGEVKVLLAVKGISVSQAMSGSWQVSVAIDYFDEVSHIKLDSVVTDDR